MVLLTCPILAQAVELARPFFDIPLLQLNRPMMDLPSAGGVSDWSPRRQR
jgi:hypothetical protein